MAAAAGLLWLAILAVPPARASDYYVDAKRGDDGHGKGTSSAPWKTIGKAVGRTLHPGDSVRVAAGRYDEQVVVEASGTSEARIMIVCQEALQCRIVGQHYRAPENMGHAAIILLGNYIEILNFDISTDASGMLGVLGYGMIGGYVISGNYVHDIPVPECLGNGGAGIDPEGTHALTSGHSIISGNRVTRIGNATGCHHTSGIYVQSDGDQILNNIVSDTAGYGIQAYHAPRNVIIAFNTVDRAQNGGIVYGTSDEVLVPAANTRVVNNIVSNSLWGFQECCNSAAYGEGNLYDHNLLFNNSKGECVYGSTGHMSSPCTGSVRLDPLYVDAARGNYHLRSDSPAIGSASPHYVPSTDADGTPRTQARSSVGAYEH